MPFLEPLRSTLDLTIFTSVLLEVVRDRVCLLACLVPGWLSLVSARPSSTVPRAQLDGRTNTTKRAAVQALRYGSCESMCQRVVVVLLVKTKSCLGAGGANWLKPYSTATVG